MRGLGALGAFALVTREALAQTPPFRVDVHHHFSSPEFVAEVTKRDLGNANMRKWTPQVSLDEMGKSGTATAMLSITRPGVWFGDLAVARRLARETNEYGARVVADRRSQFGLFAILPLPDVDGSLREIEYAYDVLRADGVAMMSNYDNIYLGDPKFAPVMEELNRRRAIVYEHPVREDRDNPLNGIELITDTTRTIHSLLYNRTVVTYPDIRFIFAHGGGTIGASIGRMGALGQRLPKGLTYEIQRFYYDTGQAVIPSLLASYKALVPVSQLLFGTDYPLGPGIAATAAGLKANGGFTDSELRAIERDNAVGLWPRLKS